MLASSRATPPPVRLIDVGCGALNSCIEHLLRRGLISTTSLGNDPNGPHLKSLNFERLDIRELREHSSLKFDMATSLAVIEHLPVDEVLSHLRDIGACLRPGGTLVLTTRHPPLNQYLNSLRFDFEWSHNRRTLIIDITGARTN